jgi:glycosyltransferase involved in cell wall biosynthesis
MKSTPETTLEDGFRAAGHQITTLSHYDDVDFSAFDVAHVHHLSYGALRLAADRSQCPFVYTNHDASQMNGFPLALPQRLSLRYVLSRADGVVSLSHAEAAFQRVHFNLRGAELVSIANGINDSLFTYTDRQPVPGSHQPWKILFVGQLIPLKGCDLLLRALAQVSHPFELSLAYQNDALKPELEQLAAHLGIASHIKFLGKKDPQQLADLYRRHHLLVLPSATEALPSVLTEAMLSGLPFVASRVGGIPEQSGGYGVVLAQRDAGHIAKAIRQVLDNYPQFVSQSAAMSAHARNMFSIPSMVSRHLELYQKLIERKQVRRAAKTPLDTLIRLALRYRGQQSPLASASIRQPKDNSVLPERT